MQVEILLLCEGVDLHVELLVDTNEIPAGSAEGALCVSHGSSLEAEGSTIDVRQRFHSKTFLALEAKPRGFYPPATGTGI